uniref:Phosphoinositide phospholipase C n=1 Tax=Ditylum brightwellii TaxID=49249 RepID=A0A7S4S4M8_9STRA
MLLLCSNDFSNSTLIQDKSNTIDCKELQKILTRINFYMKKSQLKDAYHKLDESIRKKGLSFEQCCTFLHKLKHDTWQTKPVNQIWFDLFGRFMNNGTERQKVSAESFLRKFLLKQQKEKDVELEDVRQIFAHLNQLEIANVASSKALNSDSHMYIDKDHFEAYLMSAENDVFDPKKERFDQNCMTHSLSEYWINSSHNTYLTGDQLASQSSVEMYMYALYRGCRCVELDVWDGDVDTDLGLPIPIVYHGHTMTTKIPFSDIIDAVKVFLSFNPESYPIIFSLENHCSIPFQEVMAEQLLTILGDHLYTPSESTLKGALPSPESLRGMVVLKGRRPAGPINEEDNPEDGEIDDEESLLHTGEISTGNVDTAVSHGVAPELATMTLFHGTNFKNWDTSIEKPTYHMHSFSESTVRSLSKQTNSRQWIEYNRTHLTRTFPSGKRVDSSNYSPMVAWSNGCQMVALNFQTPDSPLRINDGRFRENGGCGYILKPCTLTTKDEFLKPVSSRLSIKVLNGSCLPKPKGQRRGECIDPYVKLSLYDEQEGKEVCTNYTTSFVVDNGFFPIWNKDKYTFDVCNAAVAILQLTVWDKDGLHSKDDFIASASIPISCMRQGIRSVRLFDSNNTRSGAFDFASLLIEVKIKQQMLEEI